MIVDDDKDCVDSLARALTARGFEVLTAITERDAMSIINFASPGVLVSDAQMPGGGARELLDQLMLKENAPAVIVLSGDREPSNIPKDEVRRILQKPVDVDELSREIIRASEARDRSRLQEAWGAPDEAASLRARQ